MSIDFIQNVLAQGFLSEYERLSHVSLTLQKLAKTRNCCFLILSQLSNNTVNSSQKNTEYKGSGSIGTACDLGFFITRKEVENIRDGENAFSLELRKNRRGIPGVEFDFIFKQPGGEIVSL
jgi:replicative DNA helicase